MVNYRQALFAAKEFEKGQVFGTKEQKKFFEEVRKSEDYVPLVLFVNRILPQARIKAFTKENCPDLWRLGERMIEEASTKYIDNLKKYGKNSAWLEEVDVLNLHFMDENFPQSFYEILKGGL